MDATPPPPGLPAGFAADPGWFPFALDLASDRLLLVRMAEADLRAASFLDQRGLPPAAPRLQMPWADAAGAFDAAARRDAQFIFHVGHVGSTLVSRLLGELGGVLALREPLLLRAFAEAIGGQRWSEAETSARTAALSALLSRTFRPRQRALVKATSFTSEIADRLVPAGSRALFLYVKPGAYLETILGGDASRQELAIMTPSRIARIAARCPGLTLAAERMSEAQKAAIGWAAEMVSLERSAASLGADRVQWIDFDRFLAQPQPTLAAAAAFLGHEAAPGQIDALIAGPLMRRYSKAPEYEYSPGLRREVLADARRRFGRDMDAALAWLDELGARWPAVGAALRRG